MFDIYFNNIVTKRIVYQYSFLQTGSDLLIKI